MLYLRLFACLISSVLMSGELPLGLQMKFVKIITSNAAIACKSVVVYDELRNSGIPLDNSSKFAYATTSAEVMSMSGKLIIVPNLELLSKGASIALVEEGGKPQIYLHVANITSSGGKIPDMIYKIGKRYPL